MNRRNGFLPQGAYSLLMEVASQQENKLLHVDLPAVTSPVKGLHRVWL